MVAAAGHISGGVYNPSLTVGLMVTRRLAVGRGVYYIVAQLVGATVAALALKVLFAPAAAAAANLGTPAVGVGVGTGAAVLARINIAIFLMTEGVGLPVEQRGANHNTAV